MAHRAVFRNDTAAALTTRNEVLLQGEICIERDTGLYKFGDGVAPWNSLPYGGLRGLDETTVLDFEGTMEPAAPASGHLSIYARGLAGQMFLRQKGPSGLATPLQPSFFQNQIALAAPNGASTTMASVGALITNYGTGSHPAPTEQYGVMTNFASAATANASTGAAHTLLSLFRGSLAGGANGFFFATRIAYPDASYDAGAAGTGARTFVGVTSQNGDRALGTTATDTLAVNTLGFVRRHTDSGAQDTNWLLQSRGAGATITSIDTGLPFVAGKVYDAYLFCAPLANEIGWRIDNLTDSLTAEGIVDSFLPDGNAPLRSAVTLHTLNVVSRNLRIQRIYAQSDR